MTDQYSELVGEARFVTRDGCRVGYRVAGNGDVTLLLFSAWQITHSAAWKGQVPYLAQFYRVIAIDCRGNGLSDRPDEAAAYSPWELVADALAILDQEKIDAAIVGGFSYGGHLAALFAASYPDRCHGAILLAPTAPFGPSNPAFRAENVTAQRDHYEGWEKYAFSYWLRDYDGFAHFFIRQAFPEPHSEKQIEDALDWARDTDAATLVHTVAARRETEGQREQAYASIRCPVLVIQGTEDRMVPHEKGRLVAEITCGRFISLPGSGHMPNARIPVKINQLIREFVAAIEPRGRTERLATPAVSSHGLNRNPRALYLSSPIGLGHARRDKAIADALRALRPELTIDWLAQDPVTRFLTSSGESVHPASARLLSEARHIEMESGEHDLDAFQALRRMDSILVANFCQFQDVIAAGDHDLVVADEAWDVDRFWHDHPELKCAKLAWMTDFVGVVPLSGKGSREEALANDWNKEMVGRVEAHPDVRDAALFIGDADDVVDIPLAPGLPSMRDWTSGHFEFPGYVNGLEELPLPRRDSVRQSLGYLPDDAMCLVAVGGSGVGEALVRRLLNHLPQLRHSVPNLRMEIVLGPRIEVDGLPRVDGVKLHAYLPDFPAYMAACDVAIVQGGLSTCMELTALDKPFLYVPLERHFEQQVHVHHRLQRYGRGKRISYAELADGACLAQQLTDLLSNRPSRTRPVTPGGAKRVAARIAGLL